MPEVKVILSERAFSDPAYIAKFVASEIGLNLDSSVLEHRWDEFHQAFMERDKTKPQGSTSFPSAARDRQKIEIRELISMNSNLPACNKLYKEISLTASVK